MLLARELIVILATVLAIGECLNLFPDSDVQCNMIGHSYKVPSKDCRVYYVCTRQQMTFKSCPVGQYFDKNYDTCTVERPDGCYNTWNEPDPLPINFPVATPAPTVLQTNQQVNRCVGQTDGFVYQPSSGSGCRAYAVCWSQRSHAGECPVGFSFNAELSRCDTAGNAYCTDAEMCPAEGLFAFRKLGKCQDYHLCFDGVRTDRRCADGLQFDAVQRRCDLSSVVRCYECPLVDDIRQQLVTHAGERSDEYMVCRRGGVMRFKCATGLVWNATKHQCDEAQVTPIPIPTLDASTTDTDI